MESCPSGTVLVGSCPGGELAFPKPFSYGACIKSMEV